MDNIPHSYQHIPCWILLPGRGGIFQKRVVQEVARTAFASAEPKAELVNDQDSDLEVQSPAMLDEIHAYMEQAAKEPDLEQEAMMASIRKILNKYPTITDSFIKLSINDLVIALAESKCGIEVRPEILRELWN